MIHVVCTIYCENEAPIYVGTCKASLFDFGGVFEVRQVPPHVRQAGSCLGTRISSVKSTRVPDQSRQARTDINHIPRPRINDPAHQSITFPPYIPPSLPKSDPTQDTLAHNVLRATGYRLPCQTGYHTNIITSLTSTPCRHFAATCVFFFVSFLSLSLPLSTPLDSKRVLPITSIVCVHGFLDLIIASSRTIPSPRRPQTSKSLGASALSA
ncbi:hypothetical protein F4819DRAFT_480601 [Hypoxylon fuscum]|nr:hypothetical protein F4819DRAFT_480601 [Hypoxylon fuscum]